MTLYVAKTCPKSMCWEHFHWTEFCSNRQSGNCLSTTRFWDNPSSICQFVVAITWPRLFGSLCVFNKLLVQEKLQNESNAGADYWTYPLGMIKHDLINKSQGISSVICSVFHLHDTHQFGRPKSAHFAFFCGHSSIFEYLSNHAVFLVAN